jgi:hypothetical protein
LLKELERQIIRPIAARESRDLDGQDEICSRTRMALLTHLRTGTISSLQAYAKTATERAAWRWRQEQAVRQKKEESIDTEDVDELIDSRRSPEEETVYLDFLCRLWEAVRRLPSAQRAALLLDCNEFSQDGDCLPRLLQLRGVARLIHIADAVGLPREQFAMEWNQLPLEAARVAALLGKKPNAIYKLVHDARKQLWRWYATYQRDESV